MVATLLYFYTNREIKVCIKSRIFKSPRYYDSDLSFRVEQRRSVDPALHALTSSDYPMNRRRSSSQFSKSTVTEMVRKISAGPTNAPSIALTGGHGFEPANRDLEPGRSDLGSKNSDMDLTHDTSQDITIDNSSDQLQNSLESGSMLNTGCRDSRGENANATVHDALLSRHVTHDDSSPAPVIERSQKRTPITAPERIKSNGTTFLQPLTPISERRGSCDSRLS